MTLKEIKEFLFKNYYWRIRSNKNQKKKIFAIAYN